MIVSVKQDLIKKLFINGGYILRKRWEMEKRCSFELFKSNVCHRLKEQGDIDFLIETLKEDMIRQYYDKNGIQRAFIY